MFKIIDSIAAYDAMVEAHCLPASVTEIAGVERHRRFESLTRDEISGLNAWFREHGECVLLSIDSIEFALHILGAKQVDPATEAYNLTRGSGKDKIYYWCHANQHNRIVKVGNLGTLTKEGLVFDLANGYWGLGPAAHIDAYAWLLSLQHRILALIEVLDEGVEVEPMQLLTIVGMPPQLSATLDRGAPKTKQDQEFLDRDMFTHEFLHARLEYVENVEKLRNELAGYLVTVRNNVWSRLHGTGYHPSGTNSPSTRNALALQECFEQYADGDALQDLIVKVWQRSITEDGKKGLWVGQLSVPMVATAIVLASNTSSNAWEPGNPIAIDETIADTILAALGKCSDEGTEGYSSYVREIAKIKKQPKKPSGIERWVFWGLVKATTALLADEYDSSVAYFPSVTDALVKKLKKGTTTYPIFGGLDVGPKTMEEAAE